MWQSGERDKKEKILIRATRAFFTGYVFKEPTTRGVEENISITQTPIVIKILRGTGNNKERRRVSFIVICNPVNQDELNQE